MSEVPDDRRRLITTGSTGASAQDDAAIWSGDVDGNRLRESLLRITARRAEILREIADGYSGREVASRIGLTPSGMRSHVEALKQITGCASVRELGRWWREHRPLWIALMSLQAGRAELPRAMPQR